MVALSTLASGATTATVGTAWLSVHSRRLVLEFSRARIPVTTTKTAAIAVTTAKMPNLRRETSEFCSVGMRGLRCGGSFGALSLVYHTKDHGNEHQGSHGCEYQPSNHGTPERGVLFAALAKRQRHRRHADNHRQRRHQHGTKTHKTGLDRGRDRIAQFFIALAGKADHQHAVRGRHPHAHDRAGQRR